MKFQTFGCGAAIAVSSMVSEMAKGKSLEEAMKISKKSVIDALNGLPKQKHHCSNLGADALQRAIADYKAKMEGEKFKKPEDHPDSVLMRHLRHGKSGRSAILLGSLPTTGEVEHKQRIQ